MLAAASICDSQGIKNKFFMGIGLQSVPFPPSLSLFPFLSSSPSLSASHCPSFPPFFVRGMLVMTEQNEWEAGREAMFKIPFQP